jgi:Cu-processing system ATP-binding protein
MDLFQKFEMDKLKSKKMRTLSGGTRQKVSATLAFMFQPKVLILDEPTAGLDPIASEILKEKIIAARDQKKLILITSHILSELEDVVNRVIYMQDGEIKFSKSVDALKEESGENSMAKAILQHLKSHSYVSNS